MFAVDNSTGGLDSFGGIVSLGVGDVAMVTFPRGMILFLARMDKAFMPDEKIAAGEVLTTQVAYKGLLLGVFPDMAHEMLAFRETGTTLATLIQSRLLSHHSVPAVCCLEGGTWSALAL